MASPYPEPITPHKTRIGWIGIGVMGSAMVNRLLFAGYSVTVYTRSPSKADKLLSLGAELSPSPVDLARTCDVIFTMLSRPQDVRQIVLSQSDALLPSLTPNSVILDHTSSHPDLVPAPSPMKT